MRACTSCEQALQRAHQRRAGALVRRGGSGRASASRLGSEAAALATAPFSWMRASYYSFVGAKVTAWGDLARAGHTWAQGNATYQCLIPTADAAAKGALSADFAGGQYYVSSLAASLWAFLHRGPLTLHAVLVNKGTTSDTLLSTGHSAPTQTGLRVRALYSASFVPTIVINNGSATQSAIMGAGGAVVPAGAPWVWRFKHDASQTPDAISQVNGYGEVANYAAAVSSAAPSYTMYLGALFTVAGFGNYRLLELLIHDRLTTPSEDTMIGNYHQTRYGVRAA
jgi:hypothetical protein